jgi:hypothetical protein
MSAELIEQLILVIHLVLSLAIIGLIMLQQGKGADMGASFGAGASQTLLGQWQCTDPGYSLDGGPVPPASAWRSLQRTRPARWMTWICSCRKQKRPRHWT